MIRMYCVCNIFVIGYYLSLHFNYVKCINSILRSQSILYGISTLSENKVNLSTCYQHLDVLRVDTENHKVWALKALDASGTPTPGFLFGNNFWLGSHSECMDISNKKPFDVNHNKIQFAVPTPFDYPPFPMTFAKIYIQHNNTLQPHMHFPLESIIQLGLCVPQTCSEDELLDIITEYTDQNYLLLQEMLHTNLTVNEVQILETNPNFMLQLPKTIVLIVLISVTILLTIVGTGYDVLHTNRLRKNREQFSTTEYLKSNIWLSNVDLITRPTMIETRSSTVLEVIKCFSLTRNLKSLMKTKLSENAIGVIHGLRFFGTVWVGIEHTAFYGQDYGNSIPEVWRFSEKLFSQFLSNGTFCVDTFFFLSGFLLTIIYYNMQTKVHDKNGKPNSLWHFIKVPLILLKRILRLSPPYIVIIILTDVVFTYYSRTSLLRSYEKADVLCSNYWWRNLLYINNFYPKSEMCLTWSWYLSVDTQFFIVGTFLLTLSTLAFKAAAFCLLGIISISIAVTMYLSYSIRYIPTLDEQFATFDILYTPPWTRIGPYLIGMVTAYIWKMHLNENYKIKPIIRVLLWLTVPLLNIWVIFGLYRKDLSFPYYIIYTGVSRTVWSIGLGWLVIACCTKNAKLAQKFLSFRGWIPLSRLTYCAYLLNPLAINMIYLGVENSQSMSVANFTLNAFGLTSFTFALAFTYSLLFEAPYILLSNKLFSSPANVVTPKEDKNSNVTT